MMLMNQRCYQCGSEEVEVYSEPTKMYQRLYKCNRCSLIFTKEQEEEALKRIELNRREKREKIEKERKEKELAMMKSKKEKEAKRKRKKKIYSGAALIVGGIILFII